MLVTLVEALGGFPAGTTVEVADRTGGALIAEGYARHPRLDLDLDAIPDDPADDPGGVTVADVRTYAAAHHITTTEAKRQLAAAARQAANTTTPKEA